METNVKRALPSFDVSIIAESVRFYVDGLGFELTLIAPMRVSYTGVGFRMGVQP